MLTASSSEHGAHICHVSDARTLHAMPAELSLRASRINTLVMHRPLQVTVISRGRPADLPEGEEAGCTFRHVDGSTTMASSYANAGLATADAVIIGAFRLPTALHYDNLACTSTWIDVAPAWIMLTADQTVRWPPWRLLQASGRGSAARSRMRTCCSP